jgi:hypothetical protein
MKFETTVTIYATEEAKKKNKKPKQKPKTGCPSCEIKSLDYIDKNILKGDNE